MTQGTYQQLYSSGAKADAVYLLNEGTVYYFVTETDKYALKGSGLIIGASEIILSRAAGMETGRIENAIMDANAAIKKIEAEKFMNNIFHYSYILNSCMVMAKQVALTNEIIRKNTQSLTGNDKKLKELSVEYYRLIAALKKEYDKRRLPYLKEIITKYETSLTYKRGEAFERTIEPERVASTESLKGRHTEVPQGTILCKEGTVGDEMYILNSGSLEVLIGGNRITIISEPGTIIGEMALLLGETRAATLKAMNNVVVTPIKKSDLKDIAEKENSIFLSIAISIARRHYFNVQKIHSINEAIISREIDRTKEGDEKVLIELHKASGELSSLKNDITKIIDSKGADFLQGLV
jgi:CRP-like cAMP-binding protein